MLDFCKKILTNVSFDRFLFTKELKKSLKWMNKEERKQLKDWCTRQYGTLYGDVINDTFMIAA